MGRQDVRVNRLFERKDIFADMVNGTLHGGRQVLRAEDLERLPVRSGIVTDNEKGGKRTVGRIGDIRMQAKGSTYSVIFAGETQKEVHYAMPVRVMLYDALEYTRQIQELEKTHRERGDRAANSSEFLSGITKEDRILPVVNTVLYLGKEWDGSETLHGLMDVDWEKEEIKELRSCIPDYRINLVSARNIRNPENYRTCLRHIFQMLKYNRDKSRLFEYIRGHRNEIRHMDDVEISAAMEMLGEQKRLKELLEELRIVGEEEEQNDMCEAITEMIMDGEKKGREQGEAITLIRIVRKKLQKGQAVEKIAEDLLESPETVIRICDALKEFEPDCDVMTVYESIYGKRITDIWSYEEYPL